MDYVKSFDLFGVPAMQIPSLTGSGMPTTETEGAIGSLYMDTNTGDLYKCIAVTDGSYTWVGGSDVYTGDVAGIKAYLDRLKDKGEMTAQFSGTYMISDKIIIPAGMTIRGGTFIKESMPWTESGDFAIFSAAGDNVRLVGVTLKSNDHDQTPEIYETQEYPTTATISNIIGLYSKDRKNVAMIDCVCDKIIPARINGGSVEIRGNKIIDTPMFIWASNCDITVSDNDVTICDTGLDYYYHVYYLNQNANLVSRNNHIVCNTSTPYFDIFHFMTAGNEGTYNASGIIDGDVVTGNFQHIIDCHYANVLIKNCTITNTNTNAWYEIALNNDDKSNGAHSTIIYDGCRLNYANAAEKSYSSSMLRPVEFNDCEIVKTSTLNSNSSFHNCRIYQTLSSGCIFGNQVSLYNCKLHASGTFTGMCIASSKNLTFDFIGNRVIFEDTNTNQYLFRGASFDGSIRDNVFTGALTDTLWHTDLGGHSNNTINGTYAALPAWTGGSY